GRGHPDPDRDPHAEPVGAAAHPRAGPSAERADPGRRGPAYGRPPVDPAADGRARRRPGTARTVARGPRARPTELVRAGVSPLTDPPPSPLPQTVESDGDPGQRGLIQEVSEPASSSLMQDLRSDDRMGWLPTGGMWLTSINVNEEASRLTHDLA